MRQRNNNPAQINYVKRTSYFTAVGKYHIVGGDEGVLALQFLFPSVTSTDMESSWVSWSKLSPQKKKGQLLMG